MRQSSCHRASHRSPSGPHPSGGWLSAPPHSSGTLVIPRWGAHPHCWLTSTTAVSSGASGSSLPRRLYSLPPGEPLAQALGGSPRLEEAHHRGPPPPQARSPRVFLADHRKPGLLQRGEGRRGREGGAHRGGPASLGTCPWGVSLPLVIVSQAPWSQRRMECSYRFPEGRLSSSFTKMLSFIIR